MFTLGQCERERHSRCVVRACVSRRNERLCVCVSHRNNIPCFDVEAGQVIVVAVVLQRSDLQRSRCFWTEERRERERDRERQRDRERERDRER